MNFLCIYKNSRGKFKTEFLLPAMPQVGNFVNIKDFLYRIDYIEFAKTASQDGYFSACKQNREIDIILGPTKIIKYEPLDMICKIILYCSEVRDYRDSPKHHWLEDVYSIGEENE